MKQLLRILVATRGLILAGTLTLALAGSYLDRGTAPSLTAVSSYLAPHVQIQDGHQTQPPRFVRHPGDGIPLQEALAGHHFQPLTIYEACAQPGYDNMVLCPL